ncbi:MAG: hypothetical protein U0271_37740 [Polyangiaceae bacterium]
MRKLHRRQALLGLVSGPAALLGCGSASAPVDVGVAPDSAPLAESERRASPEIELVYQWGYRGEPTAVAVSPDGRVLAAGYYDGVVLLWSLSDGTVLFRRVVLETVYSLAYSHDGRQLAVGGERGALLLNLSSGRELRIAQDHTVLEVLFSRLGGELALATAPSDEVFVYDTFSGELRTKAPLVGGHIERATVKQGTLSARPEFERALCFPFGSLSPDGSTLALPEQDAVNLYDRSTGALKSKLSSRTTVVLVNGAPMVDTALPDAHVGYVAWSQDGILASASGSRVDLWSRDLSRLERSVGPERGPAVQRLIWGADGRVIHVLLADGTLATWNFADGSVIASLPAPAFFSPDHLCWARDGRALVVVLSPERLVVLGDKGATAPPQCREPEAAPPPAFLEMTTSRSVVWSPDHKWVATEESSGEVALWQVASKKGSRLPIRGRALTWSADSAMVAVSNQDGVEVYSLRDGRYLRLVHVPDNTWFAHDDQWRVDGDTSHVLVRHAALDPAAVFTLREVEQRTGMKLEHRGLVSEFFGA